ncbi:MAG: hypothetical protein QGG24_06780 [Vicinamibacterales bacterium]|jgi:hypothetical protein|nr:hypothetical protein [Acidobacteriota bacterium]MDP7295007.1 hypothetical protein [Vicinamibacterales bacterium]MDP7672941.1 hypothetical protein [Vicinamibacterales bacterium]HJO37247.1 hypothetical protein [Vicinamibacterales bacterium]|tara:strand:+ start:2758 stop:3633 length:876 start_codon:yes stop_codon:yes gene_type:complete
MRTARLLPLIVAAATVAGPPAAGTAQEPTLETVLERAAAYVERYQTELGSVIAEEDYLQVADGRRTRRMVSDLLVLSTPGLDEPWLAFRDVIEVDGTPVEDRLQRLEDLFLETPRITPSLRRRLVVESARFNIGAITRNANVPTMALQILSTADQPRFTFRKDGDRRIEGIETWEIEFEETASPSLITGSSRQDLFGHGTIWVEPSTGRVLETDFRAEDETVQLEIEMRVTYRADATLEMLVPATMSERYRVRLKPITTGQLARRSIEVNCEATYSNFRRFLVEVEVDIGE